MTRPCEKCEDKQLRCECDALRKFRKELKESAELIIKKGMQLPE